MRRAQLYMLLLVATLLAAAVLAGTSTPAGASGASICGGEVNVGVGARLYADGSGPGSVTVDLPGGLVAGTYDVTIKTLDNESGREHEDEFGEEVLAIFAGGPTLGPTHDLDDHVSFAYRFSRFDGVAMPVAPAAVTFRHAELGDDEPEDLTVVCIGLTLVAATPTTTTTAPTTTAPTTTAPTTTVPTTTAPTTTAATPTTSTAPPTSVAPTTSRAVTTTTAAVTTTAPEPTTTTKPSPTTSPPTGTPTTVRPSEPTVPVSPPAVPTPAPGADGFAVALTMAVDCAAGEAVIDVTNTSGVAGTLTLAVVRGAESRTIALSPDGGVSLRLAVPPGTEGGIVEVIAVGDDGPLGSVAAPVDCLDPPDPIVTVDVDCAARRLDITITNRGGEPILVEAFVERRDLLGFGMVDGGSNITFSTLLVGAEIPIRVVAGDDDLLRETIVHGCTETDVSADLALTCPAGELRLALSNAATEPRTVSVVLDDDEQTVVLAGESEALLARVIDVGAATRVRVVSELGDVLLDEQIAAWSCEGTGAGEGDDALGCATPGADRAWVDTEDGVRCGPVTVRLVVDCASGETTLTLRNGADVPVTVAISVDGAERARPTLAPLSDTEWPLADATNRLVVVEDTAAGTRLLEAVVACEEDADRTGAALGAILVAIASLGSALLVRFDPWLRI